DACYECQKEAEPSGHEIDRDQKGQTSGVAQPSAQVDHAREARSPRLARLGLRCNLTRHCSVDRFWRAEVSRHERDLYRDLPDLLVDDERAVARIEAVLLELLAQLEESLSVDVDAPRRAARIVLSDEEEHRDLHVVDV